MSEIMNIYVNAFHNYLKSLEKLTDTYYEIVQIYFQANKMMFDLMAHKVNSANFNHFA